jgi:hypothetical protein
LAALSGAAVGLLLTQPTAPEARLSIQERAPMLLLVDTPTAKTNAALSGSEIIRVFTDLLRGHTNLYPQITDPRLIQTCKGQLTCMIERLRGDFDHYLLFEYNGGLRPFDQHLRKLALHQRPHARYLLWVTDIPRPGHPDGLKIWLLDTDAAVEILHNAPRGTKDWRERCEPELRKGAILVGPIELEIETASDLLAHAGAIFADKFAPVFGQSFNWEPYGELLIDAPYDGAGILLDDVLVGTTKPGTTRLTGITQGVREVAIEPAAAPRFETTIEIFRGHVVTVHVPGVVHAPGTPVWARSLLASLGCAAAGLGLVSALSLPPDPQRFRLSYPADAGLITAGVGVAASNLLFDDPGPLLLGIGASVVAGFVSAAIVAQID